MTTAEKRRVWEKLRRWKEHPAAFVREELHAEPDPWQEEVLEAFPHNPRVIMKACKGPGKTTVLSWLTWNFLATRPHPRIGATSITGANLDSALWPELARWQNESQFLRETFHWSKTQIVHRVHSATWWAQARSWPKQADAQQQADALGGLHADYAMWVLDEMGGYPQALMATIEAVLASGIECHILGAGNPTHTTGPLYRACTVDRGLWYVATITADPDNPKAWVYSPRVLKRPAGQLSPLDHAKQQIKQYGRDNPWVMVNILGEFPPSSINALLGYEEVMAAMTRKLKRGTYEHMQKRLGVDVARYGDDRTVIFPRQGLASFLPIVMRHDRGSAVSNDIAARILKAKKDWGSEMEFIDDTVGWAHGVIDNLTVAGISCVRLNYAGKSLDPRYKNRRSEMAMKGASYIRDGAMLPYIEEMVAELTEPTYTYVNGVFVVEPKDMVKERIGKSPDLADAYYNTHALEDMPGEFYEKLRGSNKAKRDSDPWEVREDMERGVGRAERDSDPWRQ
jgi:phage terminase large subunit